MAKKSPTPSTPPATPLSGEMMIQRVKLADMRPAKYNPRKNLKPGDAEWEALSRSMDEFGYVDTIIWNARTKNIVGGHQRYEILKWRKVEEADVSVVELSPARERALNLALNKIKGGWEENKLAELLSKVSVDKSVGLAVTGFAEDEVKRICDEGAKLVEMLVGKDRERGESGEKEEKEVVIPTGFQIVVQCGDESQQKNLFEKLTKEGFECRVLVV